jgi:hypothetical protein
MLVTMIPSDLRSTLIERVIAFSAAWNKF